MVGNDAAKLPSIEGYRVIRELGRGGMGAVLLAEHQVSGQKYAIKVLHEHLADDERAGRDASRREVALYTASS